MYSYELHVIQFVVQFRSIWSIIIWVIKQKMYFSNFVNHLYDNRPNWTLLSPTAISILCIYLVSNKKPWLNQKAKILTISLCLPLLPLQLRVALLEED